MEVEGMGRAFARKFGVDGELPDFELAWLRHKQHELATRGGSRLKREPLFVASSWQREGPDGRR
jgi:hypothetical protein